MSRIKCSKHTKKRKKESCDFENTFFLSETLKSKHFPNVNNDFSLFCLFVWGVRCYPSSHQNSFRRASAVQYRNRKNVQVSNVIQHETMKLTFWVSCSGGFFNFQVLLEEISASLPVDVAVNNGVTLHCHEAQTDYFKRDQHNVHPS